MESVLAMILLPTRLHGLVPRACKGVHGAKTHLFPILQWGQKETLWRHAGPPGQREMAGFSWLPGHLTVLLWGVEG